MALSPSSALSSNDQHGQNVPNGQVAEKGNYGQSVANPDREQGAAEGVLPTAQSMAPNSAAANPPIQPPSDPYEDISPFLTAAGGGDVSRINPLVGPELVFDPVRLVEITERNTTQFQKIWGKYHSFITVAIGYLGLILMLVGLILYGEFGTAEFVKPPELNIDAGSIKIVRETPAKLNQTPETSNNDSVKSGEILTGEELNNSEKQLAEALKATTTNENSTTKKSELNQKFVTPEKLAAPDVINNIVINKSKQSGKDKANVSNDYQKYEEVDLPLENIADAPDPLTKKMGAVDNPNLLEVEGQTKIPKIGPDGRTVFTEYGRPSLLDAGKIPIAVIMYGLASDQEMLARAIRLPADITIALSPFGSGMRIWVDKLRAAGHEISLNLPIQPNNFPSNDNGPYSISLESKPEDNSNHLHWSLSRVSGYSTVYIHDMGDYVNGSSQSQIIYKELKERGLAIVLGSEIETEFDNMIEFVGASGIKVDYQIDKPLTRASFFEQLIKVEMLAQANGSILVAIAAYPNNVQRLREWAGDLPRKKLQLISVSSLVNWRSHNPRSTKPAIASTSPNLATPSEKLKPTTKGNTRINQ